MALTPLLFLLAGIGLFVYGANRRMAAHAELPSYSGGLPAIPADRTKGRIAMRAGAASAGFGAVLLVLSTVIHIVLFGIWAALIIGAIVLVVRVAGFFGRRS